MRCAFPPRVPGYSCSPIIRYFPRKASTAGAPRCAVYTRRIWMLDARISKAVSPRHSSRTAPHHAMPRYVIIRTRTPCPLSCCAVFFTVLQLYISPSPPPLLDPGARLRGVYLSTSVIGASALRMRARSHPYCIIDRRGGAACARPRPRNRRRAILYTSTPHTTPAPLPPAKRARFEA